MLYACYAFYPVHSIIISVCIMPPISLPSAAVTIDAYPSTQPVPLGTTVVLVCRVVGSTKENSSASYQWSCPNGACGISRGTSVPPRSRIVSGNTLTVNVVSKSDSGEYRCTVSEGGTTKTSSFDMTVSGECFAIRQMVVGMMLTTHSIWWLLSPRIHSYV